MSDQEKREQEIMNQEMSQEEMDTVAGGRHFGGGSTPNYNCFHEHQKKSCNWEEAIKYGRLINRPDGSANCAATVEENSWCKSNDACYDDETIYLGIKECAKAWM